MGISDWSSDVCSSDRPGFGHGKAADMLAADQLGEIFRFLIGIAPAADLVDAKVRVRAIGETDRGRRPRHFLHRDDMFEIAEAKPAELFLDGDAVQPEVAIGRASCRESVWQYGE